MDEKRIQMVVATHKLYDRIPSEGWYYPVQAGATGHSRLPYTGDDTGDQISDKNEWYCELTALYWAWKNLAGDAIGLCHYRRYFQEPGRKMPLTEETAKKLLLKTPVILPDKRNYFIETGESQFIHAHGSESLNTLKNVLRESCPDYLVAFENSLRRTSGHRFNMLLMRRKELDAYCEWLFTVLFETEKRLGTPEPRMMGFLAERLMDAWIETTNTAYTELPVFETEKPNWLKKGGAFLQRKVHGRT